MDRSSKQAILEIVVRFEPAAILETIPSGAGYSRS